MRYMRRSWSCGRQKTHCFWFLLEISCRVSMMKGRYMTMIVALGRVSQIHEEEKVEVNNS